MSITGSSFKKVFTKEDFIFIIELFEMDSLMNLLNGLNLKAYLSQVVFFLTLQNLH